MYEREKIKGKGKRKRERGRERGGTGVCGFVGLWKGILGIFQYEIE